MEDLQQDISELGDITVLGVYHLESGEKIFTDYEFLEEDPRVAHLQNFKEHPLPPVELLPGEKRTKISAKKLLRLMEIEAVELI